MGLSFRTKNNDPDDLKLCLAPPITKDSVLS